MEEACTLAEDILLGLVRVKTEIRDSTTSPRYLGAGQVGPCLAW